MKKLITKISIPIVKIIKVVSPFLLPIAVIAWLFAMVFKSKFDKENIKLDDHENELAG